MPAGDDSETEVARQALADAPWPGSATEPIFAEPWEGRAFGIAFDVVRRTGLRWEDFRSLLIASLADVPDRPYYESWVVALERLTTERVDLSPDALATARDAASWYRYDDPLLGEIDVSPFRADAVAAVVAAVLPLGATDGAQQIELYRRAGASEPCGLRAFDRHGSLLAETPMLPAEWDALRNRLQR